MITADSFNLQHERGGWLQYSCHQNGYDGREPHYNWAFWIEQDQLQAHRGDREWWKQWIEGRSAETAALIALRHFYLVPAPACGCCGQTWCITAVQGRWRCTKHLSRLPCMIEGCGKTFAMKGDDTYDNTVICGKHWRQAPKFMRNRVTRIRRIAKRRGWSPRLWRLDNTAWNLCLRSIRSGHQLHETEINKLFGWETT